MEITTENYKKQIEILEIEMEIKYWEKIKERLEKKYDSWVIAEMPFWLRTLIVELADFKYILKKIKSLQIQKSIKQNGKQIGFTPLEIEKARERKVSEFYGDGKSRGVCTFHKAKTPAVEFAMYDNYAYCFSCGWHGDVIKFIMEKENLTFPEAIKFLL